MINNVKRSIIFLSKNTKINIGFKEITTLA